MRKLFLTAAFCAALPLWAAAEAVRPTDDSVLLAEAAPGVARDALSVSRAALAADPQNVELAVSFAKAAIEQGRANADPRSYGQAQAALQPWWSDKAPPNDIRVLRAVIFQAFHDFRGASTELDAIIEAAPRNAQARLSRAMVRMVTGDPAGAAKDCTALPLPVNMLVSQVCRARIEALTGSSDKGLDRLKRALGRENGEATPMKNFAVAVAADIAAGLALNTEAEALFGAAINAGAGEASLLAAYADLLLDMGKPDRALALLDGKGEADILILRRAIAAKQIGDPRLQSWVAILNERFAASAAGGVRVHLREEARFRLEVEGDPAAALPLATQNWAVQKEPADARLLLQCALAAKSKSAADDVFSFLKRTGLSDKRIDPLIAAIAEISS